MNRNRTTPLRRVVDVLSHMVLALLLSCGTLWAQILPPPPARLTESNRLAAATHLFVRGFEFEGNRAFTSAELAKVTQPFTNREINSEELEQARRSVSVFY